MTDSPKRVLTPDDAEFFEGPDAAVSQRVDAFLASMGGKYQKAEDSIFEEWETRKYERTPVDPVEWLNSEEYLGRTGSKTFELIKEEFYRINSMTPRPMVLALTGGIGWGKTFFSALEMAWLIYELSCLRSPQREFGLSLDSRMVFMNMSITKGHARRVLFMTLKEMLDSSPYFRDVFPRNMMTQSVITFQQKKISFIPGSSSELAPLGENLFGGVIEEANFFPVVKGSKKSAHPEEEDYDAASHLFEAIWRRMQSRYQRMGRIPGMLVLNSSAKYPDDYLERLVKESDPREVVEIRKAEWETKPADRYCGRKFYMYLGDIQTMPRIVENDPEREQIVAQAGKVMEIPVEYRSAFEKDPVGALRDIAGITVRAFDRFLPDDERIEAMFNAGRKMPKAFHNRYEKGVPADELNAAVHPVNLIRREQRFGVPEQSEPIALYHPEANRYCHVDLSSVGDATGFCIVHVGEVKEMERRKETDGGYEVVRELIPVVYVDVVLRITPPEHGEIEFEGIRELIHRFNEEAGFHFASITFDQYQSRHSQQLLRKRFGDDVVKPLSVDRSPDPYLALKEAIYEKRIACPFYSPLALELRQVRRNQRTNKIEHLPNGSKDVADALAGAVYGAVKNFDAETSEPIMLGAIEQDGTALDPEQELTMWLLGRKERPKTPEEIAAVKKTVLTIERMK